MRRGMRSVLWVLSFVCVGGGAALLGIGGSVLWSLVVALYFRDREQVLWGTLDRCSTRLETANTRLQAMADIADTRLDALYAQSRGIDRLTAQRDAALVLAAAFADENEAARADIRALHAIIEDAQHPSASRRAR